MTFKGIVYISLSLLFALILSILPWSREVALFMPQWTVMVLIFWIMISRSYINIGVAWGLGLCIDALTGSFLGAHALAMAVVAYLTAQLRQFRYYSMIQQVVAVALLTFIFQVVLFTIGAFTHHLLLQPEYWLTPIISAVLWPWCYFLLVRYQNKFVYLSRI